MALKPCRECGTTISTAATACPRCGSPAKTGAGCGTVFAIGAVIVVGVVVVASLNSNGDKTLATPTSADEPSAAQQMHIRELLAPAGARWARTRPSNMVIDGAILCRDFATVDLMTQIATEAMTDRFASAVTGGKIDRMRPPIPVPNLAAFGCRFLPSGTRVLVESTDPVPFVSVEIGGATIRGVVSPAGIEFEEH